MKRTELKSAKKMAYNNLQKNAPNLGAIKSITTQDGPIRQHLIKEYYHLVGLAPELEGMNSRLREPQSITVAPSSKQSFRQGAYPV